MCYKSILPTDVDNFIPFVWKMSCMTEVEQSFLGDHDHDSLNDHYHEVPGWSSVTNTCLNLGPRGVSYVTDKVRSSSLGQSQETASTSTNELVLYSKWNYYYHLPNDKNWNLASYKLIMENIDRIDKLVALNETMTDNIIKNCMLFVMRIGVTPMWEDSMNRQGGCFSYKVTNKTVVQVWRKLTYLLCGNTLTVDPSHMDLVNGITISPKRGFCIIKIWMKNCTLQDPAVIMNIEGLMRTGCLFKAHSPEF